MKLSAKTINRATDKFFLWFVPKWFELIGWLLMMGALLYVFIKSGSMFIYIIFNITTLLICFFIWSLLANNFFLETYFEAWKKRGSTTNILCYLGIIHLVLAAILTFSLSAMIIEIVIDLAASQ